jgi:hypothetical protein
MGGLRFGVNMEKFTVKRGLIKQLGTSGLTQLGAKHFDDVTASAEGGFTASKGILTHVEAKYDGEGALVVDSQQMRGTDLEALLSEDGGRETAMESRAAWSSFLDEATGYSPKQRSDKAKAEGKKLSKAKSSIRMALKMIDMSKSISDETIVLVHELIAEIEDKIEQKNATRAQSLSEKLGKLVES